MSIDKKLWGLGYKLRAIDWGGRVNKIEVAQVHG